jgi:hypothetical protein
MKSMTTGTFKVRTAVALAMLMLAFVNGHQNIHENNLSYNANKNSFKCTQLPGTS